MMLLLNLPSTQLSILLTNTLFQLLLFQSCNILIGLGVGLEQGVGVDLADEIVVLVHDIQRNNRLAEGISLQIAHVHHQATVIQVGMTLIEQFYCQQESVSVAECVLVTGHKWMVQHLTLWQERKLLLQLGCDLENMDMQDNQIHHVQTQ